MDDLIRRQDALDCFHDWVDKRGDVHSADEMPEYEAIWNLPAVGSEMLLALANALDGTPLLYPCDKLWEPEGWCKEHCSAGQGEPDAECWLKYAEVTADGND